MIPVRTCPRRWPHASRPCTVSPPADAWRVLSVEELSALPGDLFNVGDLNERLADLATVLIPAR